MNLGRGKSKVKRWKASVKIPDSKKEIDERIEAFFATIEADENLKQLKLPESE